ncbi:MAG: hypothetical protein IPJ77_24915 [Planctomycetes bacterium]|nr:hypothetical protein [Planctomycetota bacterium]
MNNERQKPVHEIRLGLVRASIWENKSEYGVRHNVTLERLYSVKLDDNRRQWKSTGSFGRDDLLVAAKVLDLAHTWIHSKPNEIAEEQAA